MEVHTHQPADQDVSLRTVYLGGSRECLSYGYYDGIDHVLYQGFIYGTDHSVKVIDNYTKQHMVDKELPAVDTLTDEQAIRQDLVRHLSELAINVRRQLPIEGQLKLF